ncbi:hypothetical protein V8G54_023575 [Vigna mungo]|uniref:Transmembrane protein n=1 Tax=Vigna mungo TaxID=3915 RepID=A0AAQ3RPC0_VIGMU
MNDTFPCPKSIAMNSLLASSHASSPLLPLFPHSSKTFRQPHFHSLLFVSSNSNFSSMVVTRCSSAPSHSGSNPSQQPLLNDQTFHTEVTTPQTPSFLSPLPKLTSSDQAFFLLAFIASTTSVAFASFVVAAVPALFAIRNAAISLSKLADTAREELPSTMTAIRLSGMEISDLTLELSDLSPSVSLYLCSIRYYSTIQFVFLLERLVNCNEVWIKSQEVADGVNASAQVVQAAEAKLRQFSSMARQQTEFNILSSKQLEHLLNGDTNTWGDISAILSFFFVNLIIVRFNTAMIQERASLPIISLQPAVAGAARKTTRAVGRATKSLFNIISGRQGTTEYDDDRAYD